MGAWEDQWNSWLSGTSIPQDTAGWDYLIRYHQEKGDWGSVRADWKNRLTQQYKAAYPRLSEEEVRVIIGNAMDAKQFANPQMQGGGGTVQDVTDLAVANLKATSDTKPKTQAEKDAEALAGKGGQTKIDEQIKNVNTAYDAAWPEIMDKIRNEIGGGGNAGLRDTGGFATASSKAGSQWGLGKQQALADAEKYGQEFDYTKAKDESMKNLDIWKTLQESSNQNNYLAQAMKLAQQNQQPSYAPWISPLSYLAGTPSGGKAGSALFEGGKYGINQAGKGLGNIWDLIKGLF